LVWKTKDEWDKKWEEIMKLQVLKANINELYEIGDDFKKKVEKFPRENLKWEVVVNLSN